ncbi:carboxypeptidase regulatory-like domain-containing protein [Candidatus Sumerlaeota bacterium]|nr:carboxypeptidase regulatory-like domain-containing protein [Candidatus Sumerlaeota bacterium]
MDDKKKLIIGVIVVLLLIGGIAYQKFSPDSVPVKNQVAVNDAIGDGAIGAKGTNGKAASGEHGSGEANGTAKVLETLPAPTVVATPDETVREALRSPAVIVRGRVLMPDKSPAVGAPVVLQRHQRTWPTGYGGAGHPAKLMVSDVDSTLTDEKGRYELGAKELDSLAVQAHAKGTATASLNVQMSSLSFVRGKNGTPIVTMNIQLVEANAFKGVVVDGEDQPIGGVAVTAFQAGTGWFGNGAEAALRVMDVTEDDGTFSFDQLSKDGVVLSAQKDGYVPFKGSSKSLGESGKIVMKKGGGVVAGKVLHMGSNDPIENAQVQIFERLPENMGQLDSFGMSGVTDANGAFRIEGIPPGNYMMVASSGTLRMVSSNTLRAPDFGIADGELRDDFVLYLGTGTTVRGRVIDGTTHEAIAGALVRSVGTLDAANPPTATTDATGNYELANVYGEATYEGTRKLQLWATKEGYRELITPDALDAKPVTLSPGQEVATQDIELFRTVMVSGRVMTPQNAPVVGARVLINSYWDPDLMVATDPLGRFSVPMIANRKSQLRVLAEGFAVTYSVAFDLKDEPVKDLVIVVDPGATVIAKVVDPDGKKVAGAMVWIMVRSFAEDWSSLIMDDRGTTGESGTYTFRKIPTRDYPLSMDLKSINPALGARKDGFTNSEEVKPELHSNETKEVEIRLRGEMKHFAAGVVRDPEGKPLQGVALQSSSDNLNVTDTTKEDGSFRMEGLGEPPYYFRVYHADYGMDGLNVKEADRTDLELVMGKNQAILTGIVMDADSKEPIGDFEVERLLEGTAQGSVGQPVKDPRVAGTFRVPRAQTGVPYRFRVSATGYAGKEVTVTVPQGEKEFIQVIELKRE